MRPEWYEVENPQSNKLPKHDDAPQYKLNQSLLTQSNFILFLLIFVSLLVNATHGYGYNVAIGCGIYFLSTKNHFLYKMIYFYILVLLTIFADGISIALLYKKVSVFHWAIAPVIEIILKLVLLGFEGYRWFAQTKYEKQRHKTTEQKQEKLRKQIEDKRIFEMEQRKYLGEKKEKVPTGSSYYQQKKYHNLEQNYNAQAYKQFDYQEFVQEQEEGNKHGSKKR